MFMESVNSVDTSLSYSRIFQCNQDLPIFSLSKRIPFTPDTWQAATQPIFSLSRPQRNWRGKGGLALLEIHIAYLKISNYRKWAAIQILQFNRWSAEYLGAVRCENMLRNFIFYFCEIMLKINRVKKVNNICAHQNLITVENSFLKQMQPNLPQIYWNSLTRIWVSYLVRLYSGNNFQPFPKWFWNALVVTVKPHSASDN